MRVHTGDKPPKKQNTNNARNGTYETVRLFLFVLVNRLL